MIYGVGIDLVELKRVESAQAKNENFAKKVLTHLEWVKFEQLSGQRKIEYLAGRFAVKEAYSKAFGTGLGQVHLHDVETLTQINGKPEITNHPFDGQAHVSVTHTSELAMAEVILERE